MTRKRLNIGEQLANDIHGTTSPITGTISPIMTKNIADIFLSFKEVDKIRQVEE